MASPNLNLDYINSHGILLYADLIGRISLLITTSPVPITERTLVPWLAFNSDSFFSLPD